IGFATAFGLPYQSRPNSSMSNFITVQSAAISARLILRYRYTRRYTTCGRRSDLHFHRSRENAITLLEKSFQYKMFTTRPLELPLPQNRGIGIWQASDFKRLQRAPLIR